MIPSAYEIAYHTIDVFLRLVNHRWPSIDVLFSNRRLRYKTALYLDSLFH